MAIDQKELALLTAELTIELKNYQNIQKQLQQIGQRVNLVNSPEPKDQFGDAIPESELEKHFNRAKADYEIFKTEQSNRISSNQG